MNEVKLKQLLHEIVYDLYAHHLTSRAETERLSHKINDVWAEGVKVESGVAK